MHTLIHWIAKHDTALFWAGLLLIIAIQTAGMLTLGWWVFLITMPIGVAWAYASLWLADFAVELDTYYHLADILASQQER